MAPLARAVFHAHPDLGGWGASSLAPPPEKILGGLAPPPPPQNDARLTSCGGPERAIFPQNQGKNGQIFPLAPKALAEFLKVPTIGFKLAQILRQNGLKTQQLLQKCPWWRKNVHIASNTLKTTLKYVKTALRAPKARAKNFAQNLPPPRIFVWGGAPPSLARPLHETLEGLPNNSQLLVGWRTFARFWALCSIEYILSEMLLFFSWQGRCFRACDIDREKFEYQWMRVRSVRRSDEEYLCVVQGAVKEFHRSKFFLQRISVPFIGDGFET